MQFLELPTSEATDCYLAHSCRADGQRIAKGTRLNASLIEQLRSAGFHRITVARLGTKDVHEDTAAQALADALSGEGVVASTARTGRVNLQADSEGLLVIDRDMLLALNAIDESITCATLNENRWVTKGRMLAAIKIIPYAVPRDKLDRVIAIVTSARQPLSVCTAKPKTMVLVQTRLPSIKESVLDKTFEVTRQRLLKRGTLLLLERRCEHTIASLCSVLEEVMTLKPDIIMIVGASAISDIGDIVPQAIKDTGGTVQRFGIPVDPGNLLLLAQTGSTALIGAPGCARSPKDNGLDRVLDRLVCELPIENSWLDSLSIGGLLDEDVTRPSPRQEASPVHTRTDDIRIGALVLAAGASGEDSDSYSPLGLWQGKPLITQIVNQIQCCKLSRVVVVTGHNADAVRAALSQTDKCESVVKIVDNPDWASGLGYSIATGIRQLLDCDAILVCLANDPLVSSETINRLLQHFRTHADSRVVVPVYSNRSGNPVLISNVFFDALMALRGDSGARFIQTCYPDSVRYVNVDDPPAVTPLKKMPDFY